MSLSSFVRVCVRSLIFTLKQEEHPKYDGFVECFKDVSRVSQECFKSVSRLFQEFQEGFKHVFDSTVFQELGSTILLGPEKFPE